MHAIGGTRNADLLLPRAILPQVVDVKIARKLQNIRIGHTALVPAPARAGVQNRRGFLDPAAAVV